MDPPQDFKSLQEAIQIALVSTVKSVNHIAAEDLAFQRTAHQHVAEQLDEQSARLLALSNQLLQAASKACGIKPPRPLDNAEDVELSWRGIVDVVDSVLEKVDTSLDEYTGLMKRKEAPIADGGPPAKKPKQTQLDRSIRCANIAKPQAKFERQPDNFPTTPWKPLLTSKPHATVPLSESLVQFNAGSGRSQYKHPYEAEIVHMTYPPKLSQRREPILYQAAEGTAATWVDTFDGVLGMLKELKEVDEIAIDLEHHDLRTYFGIVSLMQISTREKDWIVDTLQPWRHKLEVLNEVFCDPLIIKVFHGAHKDIIWLQRDLGLYVNGLFDTYFACGELYPTKSLAYLLKRFVDFDADKKYQMADWRIRPLTDEMFYYARSDTHYLLYIYDMVHKDLLDKSDSSKPTVDHLERVLQKCKSLALSRYEHLGCDPESGEGMRGWSSLLAKHNSALSGEQFAVFRALWNWRDYTARREDESPYHVLPHHAIFDISKILPPDAKALHSLIPPPCDLAKAALTQLWDLVRDARVQGRNGPTLFQFIRADYPKEELVSRPAPLKPVTDMDGIVAGRMDRSQLFGDMPMSSFWDNDKPEVQSQSEYIQLPWRRYVQSYDAQQDEAEVNDVQDVAAPRLESIQVDEGAKMDREFTLKRRQEHKENERDAVRGSNLERFAGGEYMELDDDIEDGEVSGGGKKGNAKQVSNKQRGREKKLGKETHTCKDMLNTSSAGDDAAEIDDQDAEEQGDAGMGADGVAEEPMEEDADAARQAAVKTARKGARKLKKSQKRMSRKAAASETASKDVSGNEEGEDAPFDYSKAASVLHAKREETSGAAPGKKSRFNPYAKSGESDIKGARRAPTIAGTRTATFSK